MKPRLPWQRHDGLIPNAFIAYPDGEDRKDRFVMVWQQPSLPKDTGQWRWTATIADPGNPRPLANENGVAMTKQEAADRATEAWPRVVEAAEGET